MVRSAWPVIRLELAPADLPAPPLRGVFDGQLYAYEQRLESCYSDIPDSRFAPATLEFMLQLDEGRVRAVSASSQRGAEVECLRKELLELPPLPGKTGAVRLVVNVSRRPS